MDDVTAALTLIRCLDLTSLNDDDSEYTIATLCSKASTEYGKVAALCVYPRFIPQVKRELSDASIAAATVVNFPRGDDKLSRLSEEIKTALSLGADEIDAVFPYRSFLKGAYKDCEKFLETARRECGKKHKLKVILETGELQKASLIAEATKLCIDGGADFIKTSTGKSKISATPEAANAILETVAAAKRNIGFKASGGIKTIDDAKKYLVLANAIMGSKWVNPKNFRIGASSLLDNLIQVIKQGY